MLAARELAYAVWLPNHRAPEAYSRARVTVHIPRRPYCEVLRGIPTTINSTSFSRIMVFRRAKNSAKGSAGMYSSGCPIIFNSSLMEMPMRFVP